MQSSSLRGVLAASFALAVLATSSAVAAQDAQIVIGPDGKSILVIRGEVQGPLRFDYGARTRTDARRPDPLDAVRLDRAVIDVVRRAPF